MKKEIDLKKMLRSANKRRKGCIGCALLPLKVFAFVVLLCVICAGVLVVMHEGLNHYTVAFLMYEMLFVFFLAAIYVFVDRMTKKGQKDKLFNGKQKVVIKDGIILNKDIKGDINYFSEHNRYVRTYLCEMRIDDAVQTVDVGMSSYVSLKSGAEVYVVSVNDRIYGNFIFDKEKYCLGGKAKEAYNNEIVFEL